MMEWIKRVLLILAFYPVVLFCLESELNPDTQPRSEAFFKNFQNYRPDVYDFYPQNWCLLQDKRGIIYTANQEGILEFDGVSWNTIFIPQRTARSIARAPDGTIYIGGRNEMGYLAPNAEGKLEYVSLMNHLEENQRNFYEVYQVLYTSGGIWFRTAYKLFRWHAGHFTVKNPEKAESYFKSMFTWKGKCYIQQAKVGLKQVEGNSFRPLPGPAVFTGEKIAMAVPYDDQRLLVGTSHKGFSLYDGESVTPFPTEVDESLEKNRLYHGIRLAGGDFALATLKGGLMIIDAHGRLIGKFSTDSGLQDDEVNYVLEDSGGSVWLGLNKGISRIDYMSPAFLLGDGVGLKGLILSVVRHKKRLHVGTSRGLFYAEPSSPGTLPQFRPIHGVPGDCWSLLPVGDSLLTATSVGIFLVENSESVRLLTPQVITFVLTASRTIPGFVWVGTDNGLLALRRKNGQWTISHRIDCKIEDVKSIVEEDNGNLWLGTHTNGVLKLIFAEEKSTPKIIRFGPSHGLPEGEVYVVPTVGRIVFATSKGLYRFDKKKNVFFPTPFLGEQFSNGSRDVSRMVEGRDKHIWICSDGTNHQNRINFHVIPTSGGGFIVSRVTFPGIPRIPVNAVYPDGSLVWFASNGLIRYDTTLEKSDRSPFSALVRKVTKKGGAVVYSGFKTHSDLEQVFPVLEYKERNLRFDVAAPFPEDNPATQYQYFMDGFDDEWSEWTGAAFKHYTNLDFGRYTFRVRAKNVYGTISSEDSLSFKVLPPWYFTWWAYLLYTAIAAYMVTIVVKWRSRQLVLEKQKLEQIVDTRTQELTRTNSQLQQKTSQLEEQSEQLKEMDKIKSRFFANISHEFRTPLTLIMGPLDHIRDSTSDKKEKQQIDIAYRNAQRLLELINQLLDLSKFESGKMKLAAVQSDLVSFLKRILEPFQAAAAQRKLNLSFHTTETHIPLYFDPEKLEKVIANLISNAFKFTPPEGHITVSAAVVPAAVETSDSPHESKGYVEISIKDTGCGIPGHQLAHIFERFYQAGTTTDQHHTGTGIGLALVKEMVELHYGKMKVRSKEGEDSGTEFILRFPMGCKHLSPGEIAESHPSKHEKKDIPFTGAETSEFHNGGDMSNQTEKNIPMEKTTYEKDIILVVEDNTDLRHYIRTSLEPEYAVVEAKDGMEGFAIVKRIIPDLIISDIMMPGTDGYTLCRSVKNDVATSHIPVILLTARASEESMIQGLETGADDYITKPFNTRILCARIKNLIDLRRQIQLNLTREMLMQPSRMTVSPIDREFLKDLKAVVDQNMSDPDFNVEEMSKRLFMSRATLYRKIQALSGESPTDFIRLYRLKRAAQLLKNNYGSITEVAFEVGFSSRAYFTKCFKEKFHRLPSDYMSAKSS